MSAQALSAVSLAIDIDEQSLRLRAADGLVLQTYSVSTALAGVGELQDSGCTPRGVHRIRACIGANQPLDAVFVGRRPTGEIWSEKLAQDYPGRDWILTRILWLCGCEPGRNRLGQVDTMRRYIYIHGTPASEAMGVPRSHGCIRMRSVEVAALFAQVGAGTLVDIQ